MPTKEELRTNTLLERGLVRVKDDNTRHFVLHDNSVDKTPLMLYTEGITSLRIEEILLKQMSTWRLAEWISHQIGRKISQTIVWRWRQKYKIKRERRYQ